MFGTLAEDTEILAYSRCHGHAISVSTAKRRAKDAAYHTSHLIKAPRQPQQNNACIQLELLLGQLVQRVSEGLEPDTAQKVQENNGRGSHILESTKQLHTNKRGSKRQIVTRR